MSGLIEKLNASLAGRYEIQRELGAGGQATVFLAQDIRHHRSVAIKVLHPELTAMLGSERFLREIQTTATLNHPHIVPLFDSGSADGLLYYVMPYAEGESLRQRLAREKQLSLEDAVRIARETADALDYAHRGGVVHRDIKPENILLVGQHVMVSDFGIARALVAAGGKSLTAPGLPIGTAAYISPEQGSGTGDIDGRSDQYSLACVLYEMLAGQPPFTGPTDDSLRYQHLNASPRSITDLRPAAHGSVERALGRALAKTPADRFGTVVEFVTAIAVDVRVEPPPPPPVPWPRRLALFAGAALVVAVVAWASVESWRRWGPHPQPPAATNPVHARSEIAVLPFQNLSADETHAYFAGGLHDELLTQLTKVTSLKVISRTSVMGYPHGTAKPLRTIAQELGVGTIVEGSVQVVGQRLRVNVQLIDAATDENLWAERYDRTLDDAFAIQSEVAQQIVAAVGAALTRSDQEKLTAGSTANAAAYRFYLQGREYAALLGRSRQKWEIAQTLYEQALALDPTFALAHAALSQVHGQMWWWKYDPSVARAARQREEAETALRLAPNLPQAHIAMGLAYYWGSREYRRALDEFAIALEGLPNDAELWTWISAVHRRMGDLDRYFPAFEKALRLDPRNVNTFLDVGQTYEWTRRYPDAVQAFERALSLAPDLHQATIRRGETYVLWQGRLDTLRAVLGRVPSDAVGVLGSVPAQRARLLLWERNADSLLHVVQRVPAAGFSGMQFYRPGALYAAWAYQMRGDRASARAAFDSARVHLDVALREFPDDWRIRAARGLAMAGLGRQSEALREARWLQESILYREDAYDGALLAEERAKILAQAGEPDAALDEVSRLLARPAWLSVQTLRLDPLWDPIREHPRFKALLVKYGSGEAM